MPFRPASPLSAASLLGVASALALSLLTGCGAGALDTSGTAGAAAMTGVLHGGANPVVGAAMTLYVTNSGSYGATATAAATTTTGAGGSFNFTLPGTSAICPAGQFAYVVAYSGSTGATSNNTGSLLMVPVGACGSNYSFTGGVNTYTGPSLWIDEVTTAISAYALSGFMSVTNAGVVNIGAPANNSSTASSATPSAAGLAHAFANALTLMNVSTGQPAAYTNGGTSSANGGVIPDAELFTLGNILQACVNSTGTTGTITATSNDGTSCGKLFSLTTPPPPSGGSATVPTNTLQAALDLAQFPIPHVNTWSSDCTAAGSGTATGTTCLFNLQPSVGAAFVGGLSSAPPDWTLAVVYRSGYGVQTGSACTSTCPGLTYPFYVALDYMDNVYVLNFGGGPTSTTPITAASYTNIVALQNSGLPLFSTAQDATDLEIASIGTNTLVNVFGVNTNATAGSSALKIYSSTGTLSATVSANTGANEGPVLADPLNNIYIASEQNAINLRKASYSAGTYTIAALTDAPATGSAQISYGNNLDLYFSPVSASSVAISLLPNASSFTKGTPAAATYTNSTIVTAAVTGNTNNATGVAGNSNGGAYTIDSAGITPITKNSNTSISAGTAVAISPVISGTLYSRGLIVDGLNNAYSPDGANGSAVSGVSVYNAATGLNLGTYLGCYVISSACGTAAGSVPMYSPRAAAIDSAGDIWVVSGASANLTELIGAAAPTWPGLSMGLTGEPR